MAVPSRRLLTRIPQERIESLFAHPGTETAALTGREAERRLAQFGTNEITRNREIEPPT